MGIRKTLAERSGIHGRIRPRYIYREKIRPYPWVANTPRANPSTGTRSSPADVNDKRYRAVRNAPICQVCGDRLLDKDMGIVLGRFNVSEYHGPVVWGERIELDGALMHFRCAKLVAGACPAVAGEWSKIHHGDCSNWCFFVASPRGEFKMGFIKSLEYCKGHLTLGNESHMRHLHSSELVKCSSPEDVVNFGYTTPPAIFP